MPRRVRKKQTKKSTPVISAPPADDNEEESGWYVIKDIIDERRVRGKVEYLIDWEDNPKTGKSYDPTWAKSRDVTKEARDEWQEKKRAKKQKPPSRRQSKGETQDVGPDPSLSFRGAEASQESNTTQSQLVRSRSPTADESDLEPVRKKTKLNHIVSPSPSLPSASVEPIEPITATSSKPATKKTLSVEIQASPSFNPADYQRTYGASQATALSSQPIPELDPLSPQLSYRTIPDSEDPSSLTASLPSANPVRAVGIEIVIPDSQDQTQESNYTQHHDSARFQKSSGENLPTENRSITSSDASRDIPSHQPNQLEVQDNHTQDSPHFTPVSQSGCAPNRLVSQQIEESVQREELRSTIEDSARATPSFLGSQPPKFLGSLDAPSPQRSPQFPLEEPSDRLSQAAQAHLNTFSTYFSGPSPADNASDCLSSELVCLSANSALDTARPKDTVRKGELKPVEQRREVSQDSQRSTLNCAKGPSKGRPSNQVSQSSSGDCEEKERSQSVRETNSGRVVGGPINQGSSRDFEKASEPALQARSADADPKFLDEEFNPAGTDGKQSAEATSSQNQSFQKVDLNAHTSRFDNKVETTPAVVRNEELEESRPSQSVLPTLEPSLDASRAFLKGKKQSPLVESFESPKPSPKPLDKGSKGGRSIVTPYPLGEVTKVTSSAKESSLQRSEPSKTPQSAQRVEEVQPKAAQKSLPQASEDATEALEPHLEGTEPSEAYQSPLEPKEVRSEVPEPLLEAGVSPLQAGEASFDSISPGGKENGSQRLLSASPSVIFTGERLAESDPSRGSPENYNCGPFVEQGVSEINSRGRIEIQREHTFQKESQEPPGSTEPECIPLGDSEGCRLKNKQDGFVESQQTKSAQGNTAEKGPGNPHPDQPSSDHHHTVSGSLDASARSSKSGSRSIGQSGTPTNSVSDQTIPREHRSPPGGSLRQSASDIVQEILDSWGKENHLFSSTEMFPTASTSSDNHEVSAITELQNLWDSDDEVVAEPQQAVSMAEAGPSLSLGLSSSGASEAHGDLSNPGASPEFLTQAPPWTSATAELPHLGGELASSTEIPQRSATDSMRDIINQAYGGSEPITMALMPPQAQNVEPVTVSPADISRPTEAEKIVLPVIPIAGNEAFGSLPGVSSSNSISMAQLPQTDAERSSSSSPAVAQNALQINYVVTIPFQSSIRSLYDEVLLKSRKDITEFGSKFTQDTFTEPDKYLVEKIDTLFSDLQNICDYPQDIISPLLKDLPAEDKVKYSLDANSKLNFIYELFLRTKTDTQALIVARSPNILRMLCDLAEYLELECTCDALEYKSKPEFKDSSVRLTLVPSESTIDAFEYDVVLGYDNSFQDSPIAQALAWDNRGKAKPLVLKLATAYSIEHLSLEISDTDGNLERRNALLYAIVQIRDTFRDPPRLMEPHKVAAIFSDFLNDDTQTILWEPVTIPPHALDAFTNSQEMGQMSLEGYLDQDNGRKHRLDDDDDPDTKRQRINSTSGPSRAVFDIPPLSDQVRDLLESVEFTAAGRTTADDQITISLHVMEKIAEKVAEAGRVVEMNNREPQYKDIIFGLEKQVKEFQRTNDRAYESHRAALQDRTKFETDAHKAEAALQANKEASQATDDKNRQKIAQLEETVARLMKESPAGENEKLFQETNAKVQVLEKRLETSHKNEEYVRQLYQDATASTSALRAENQTLKEVSEDLKKKASDNLRSIHEINNNNAAREYLRQISDLQTRLKDREMELDRAREELRQLKNGRRETRQVSVPRSPRMGMMSPRPGRAAFGASSRAGSPVPAYDNAPGVQSGNGRFSHLRD
ncbi:unnamed protein product [Clonostachys byssicola]|uniref:Chromo domain-containing protein n=1 Tax=Clonostachys byssicola TaxID=160290 RepID=A0A9N9UUS6_9HYPO|nr:unnamed protein product [Clonostachys byssicola]